MKWISVQSTEGRSYALALDHHGMLHARDPQQPEQVVALGPPSQISASFDANGKRAVLSLPGVGTVFTDQLDVIDAWFEHLDLSGQRSRDAKRMSPGKLVGVILGSILLTITLTIWIGVPWLAKVVARNVPSSWEKSLSEGTLGSLEGNGFSASKIPEARQVHYREQFARLTKDLDYDLPLRLEFRSWEAPNAFAVPGGLVVITDEMLALMENDEEFLAVMAHEVGHLENRHGLRSVLAQGGAWLVVSLVVGDTSGLASVATALPSVLIDSAYSRGFESEADEYAFAQLKRLQVSPKAFASLMRKMQEKTGSGDGLKYFSSHPPTDDRIEAAERAAR